MLRCLEVYWVKFAHPRERVHNCFEGSCLYQGHNSRTELRGSDNLLGSPFRNDASLRKWRCLLFSWSYWGSASRRELIKPRTKQNWESKILIKTISCEQRKRCKFAHQIQKKRQSGNNKTIACCDQVAWEWESEEVYRKDEQNRQRAKNEKYEVQQPAWIARRPELLDGDGPVPARQVLPQELNISQDSRHQNVLLRSQAACFHMEPINDLVTVRWLRHNTNTLLHQGYKGVKTGNTCSAGFCQASWFCEEEREVIVIVLGCSRKEYRESETIKLTRMGVK